MHDYMNTREVADYLRIKERKVYDLVARHRIPCARVTGKWLFPKSMIDLWVLQGTEAAADVMPRPAPPMVAAGSHDPLLDWAIAESESGLAMLFNGSLDGVRRFAAGQALLCGMHVFDAESRDYNLPLVRQTFGAAPVVLVEWAKRSQGLIVASGNPLKLTELTEVAKRQIRFADRQPEAGSRLLLTHLLAAHKLDLNDLTIVDPPVRSETEVAMAVLDGRADVGFGIAAAAKQFRLGFVPLHGERYDLLLGRRDYFEPPFQKLLAFARGPRFAARAADLAGYDTGTLGRIVYNGP